MENKETITHLNSKVWYRFLKVLFVFVILVSILIFNLSVISGGAKITGMNNSKTKIFCYNKSFTPENIGINLSYSDYLSYSSGGVDDVNYQIIIKKCYFDPESPESINSIPHAPVNLFTIKPVYIYNYNHVEFIQLLVIGNLVILVIFEAIRRLFYYIVLGSLRPKKIVCS